jgi:hypothetical protein
MAAGSSSARPQLSLVMEPPLGWAGLSPVLGRWAQFSWVVARLGSAGLLPARARAQSSSVVTSRCGSVGSLLVLPQ